MNHGFGLLAVMERGGVIKGVKFLSFCIILFVILRYIVRDMLFVICVIESIVLHRSLLAVPNTFMSLFSPLLQK